MLCSCRLRFSVWWLPSLFGCMLKPPCSSFASGPVVSLPSTCHCGHQLATHDLWLRPAIVSHFMRSFCCSSCWLTTKEPDTAKFFHFEAHGMGCKERHEKLQSDNNKENLKVMQEYMVSNPQYFNFHGHLGGAVCRDTGSELRAETGPPNPP